MEGMKLRTVLLVSCVLILIPMFDYQRAHLSEARYLPTRSQEDRLLRLKEMLHELLKSDEKESTWKNGPAKTGNRVYYGSPVAEESFYPSGTSHGDGDLTDGDAYNILMKHLLKEQQLREVGI